MLINKKRKILDQIDAVFVARNKNLIGVVFIKTEQNWVYDCRHVCIYVTLE